MVSRRWPRPVFLPAALLWAPLLVGGLGLLIRFRASAQEVGTHQFSVKVMVMAPKLWFADLFWGIVACVILALGVVGLLMYSAQPDPKKWHLVASEYPMLLAAGVLFFIAGALAMWRVHGDVLEVTSGGLQWRFIATLRTRPGNVSTYAASFLLSSLCLFLSLGRAGVLGNVTPVRRPAADPDAQKQKQ